MPMLCVGYIASAVICCFQYLGCNNMILQFVTSCRSGWFGLVVTALVTLTKLTYIDPG